MTKTCCVPLLLLLFSAGCPRERISGGSEALRFQCRNQASFELSVNGREATVAADGRSYSLRQARTSFTRKYAAGDAVFIQDEDRAVLVGVEGGPFNDCRVQQ